jgi:hypothetical protein
LPIHHLLPPSWHKLTVPKAWLKKQRVFAGVGEIGADRPRPVDQRDLEHCRAAIEIGAKNEKQGGRLRKPLAARAVIDNANDEAAAGCGFRSG